MSGDHTPYSKGVRGKKEKPLWGTGVRVRRGGVGMIRNSDDPEGADVKC